MKKIYLLVISLCFAIAASAQSYFQVGLPGTEATAIIQNPAGNFVVVGNIFPTGFNADVLIYEIDSASGSVIRSKQFTTSLSDVPHSICNTFDGNYLVTGYIIKNSSDNDLFVAKLDTGFNIIWYRQMGVGPSANDYGNSVEVVDTGLYAVTGTVAITGSAMPSIIYLNDSGNVVKEFHLNTNQFASPNFKAKLLSDGTFGFIHLTNDLCIVDTAGTILKNNLANYGIFSTDMLLNANGEYAVLAFADYGSPQGGTSALSVYDNTGTNFLVNKKVAIAGNDLEPKQIFLDNGNYLISANAMNLGSGNTNGVLIKLNAVGDLIWAKQFTPAGVAGSVINSLMIAKDGSYVIAGQQGAFPNTTFYIVKMDTSGNVCQSINLNPTVSASAKINVTPHAINPGTTPVVSTALPSDTLGPDTTFALCSGTNGIKEHSDYSSTLYPNPSNDRLHIEITFIGESIVTIFSVEGKIMANQRLNQKGNIDIHSLSPGVYMLRINDTTGKMISQQKFLKF